MHRFQIIILSIYVLCSFDTQAQSVIAEFSLPRKKIENIQSYATGDNIYLFYDEHNSDSGLIRRSCQINVNGTCKELVLEHIEKSSLIDVREVGDTTWLYYLTGKKSALNLKAMVYNKTTGKSEWLNNEIEIYGQILAISNDDTLSIITYDKEQNQLEVLRVNRFKKVYDKLFDVPIDLSKDYMNVSFIQNDDWASIEQGASKFKMYIKNNKLILSIDYTYVESMYTKPQTMILLFDLLSGAHTVKNLETKIKSTFRSFIYNDILYRTYASKKLFQLEVLKLSTGALIQEKEMPLDTTLKKSFVYLRNGKTNRIINEESKYKMMTSSEAWEPSVIALPGNDSCQTTIVWSSYYPGNTNMMIIMTHPLIGMIVSSIVVSSIMQMREPAGLSRYFYINSDCGEGINSNSPAVKSQREIIDAYELSLDLKRIFFKYKAYLSLKNRPIGLYYSERTQNIKLVRF